MYLRHTTVRKHGKTHSYWRLVRSVRRGRKVVQETVAQLGELDGEGRARAHRLALKITGRAEQYELFEATGTAAEPIAVRLDRVRLERGRRFGDVWLGWVLWRALDLDRFCSEHLIAGRERVAWSAMAAILVIARLCEPSSELHSPRNIFKELAAIQSTDVVLPTATRPERELRLRCVVRPDRAQAALLQRLGLRQM